MTGKKILFLLGSANMSGGTYVILQHAHYLQSIGHDVTVALVYMRLDEFSTLKNSDTCWHPALNELHFIHIDDAHSFHFDVAIFTWWATLFSFEKINAEKFLYFVQSIESRFYDENETFMRHLVERTYQVGLPVITEAQWIKSFLQTRYANQVELARNGILKSIYTNEGDVIAKKNPDQLRILVEGPIDAPYKNVAKTVELCRQANVGEIWLLTSSAVEDYKGVDRVFSRIPIQDVASVYRSCDVLVKLSYVEGMFGPPLEMFHCGGTAIVYDVTGFDEYIKHNENALVVKTGDEKKVIEHLKKLHEDRNLLQRLQQGANKTAAEWIDWQQSSNDFATSLEKILLTPFNNKQKLSQLANINKLLHEHIDVLIQKNGRAVQMTLEAMPLYMSGAYTLSITIESGNTQLGIIFGKKYQRLFVTQMDLCGMNGCKPDGKIDITLHEITQLQGEIIECQSEQSMLVANILVQDENNNPDAKFRFDISFQPITIRETANTTATASL